MHMHASMLGATLQGWNHLAGVEQSGRIEGLLHLAETLQFGFLELRTHLVDFLDADAVFAGDGAAYFDA